MSTDDTNPAEDGDKTIEADVDPSKPTCFECDEEVNPEDLDDEGVCSDCRAGDDEDEDDF